MASIPFLEERVQVFEMWFQFALEMSLDAMVRTNGDKAGESLFLVPSEIDRIYEQISDLDIGGLLKTSRTYRKAKAFISVNIARSVEDLFCRFFDEKIPQYRLDLSKCGVFNLNVSKTIFRLLSSSLRLNFVSRRSISALQVFENYLLTTTDSRQSELWVETYGYFCAIPLYEFRRAEFDRLAGYLPNLKQTAVCFPIVKEKDYFDEEKVVFWEQYLSMADNFWDNDKHITVWDWMVIKEMVKQYRAPTMEMATNSHLIVQNKLECIEHLISICPSIITMNHIVDLCATYRPSLLFDTMQAEQNNPESKLFMKGVFNPRVTTSPPRHIIPFRKAFYNISDTHKKFMLQICSDCLKDKNEPLDRKLMASVWLGKGNIANVEQIHSIYLELCQSSDDASNPVSPLVKRNLFTGLVYKAEEFSKVLQLVLTKDVLEDRDLNVFMLDALVGVSDSVGERFTSELRNILEASESVVSKLGVASMKALVRLIIRSRNSVDILIGLWKRYKKMNESVACYILNSLCGMLDDDSVDTTPIWDAIKSFVDEQQKPDIKIYYLFGMLMLQQPAVEIVNLEYTQFKQPSQVGTLLLGIDLPSIRPFLDLEVFKRFFMQVVVPLYEKSYDEENIVTQKTKCLAISAFENWFGIDTEMDLKIVQHVMKYCEDVSIPWNTKDDTGFLYNIIPNLYRFVYSCVQYYQKLDHKGYPTATDYLCVTELYRPFIESTMAKMMLDSVTELEKFSGLYKIDLILSLKGMKKRVSDHLDEGDMTKKRRVLELMGKVYEKFGSLPK